MYFVLSPLTCPSKRCSCPVASDLSGLHTLLDHMRYCRFRSDTSQGGWRGQNVISWLKLSSSLWEVNYYIIGITLPETNSWHLKMGFPKRKLIFQPSISRCYVSFREGKSPIHDDTKSIQILGESFRVICFIIFG